jgi:hypothetical protein
MAQSGKSGTPASQAIDPEALIDALRTRGAEGFDPVRFRFIEALARRTVVQPETVKRGLESKLAKLLSDYGERFEQARQRAGAAPVPAVADDPGQSQRGPLAALLDQLAQHASAAPAGGSVTGPRPLIESPGELKSMTYFRSTWSQLSVDQQLAQALAQVPDNAGPMNSHLLALQSLKLMNDVAPDYLKRFMSYLDALFWLDQADSTRNPGRNAAPAGDGEKKRKSGRRSAG